MTTTFGGRSSAARQVFIEETKAARAAIIQLQWMKMLPVCCCGVLDMMRTSTNVWSDLVGTAVITRFEGRTP